MYISYTTIHMPRFPWGIPKIEKFPINSHVIGQTRFELPYLRGNLYAWVVDDAALFENPMSFQPKQGCQGFMQTDPSFWEELFKPLTRTKSTAESELLITLSQEEAEGILSGDQIYLLRSQRCHALGRVHLCVKSLGFTILGSVQLEGTQHFNSLKTFRSWEGPPSCNPLDVDPASPLMSRLKQGKDVYAVTLASPRRAATTVEWCSPVAWSKFVGTPSEGISEASDLTPICLGKLRWYISLGKLCQNTRIFNNLSGGFLQL